MIRRNFLSTLAGIVGGLFAARPAQARPKFDLKTARPNVAFITPPRVNPEQFARVFRHDGEAWKEIQWEEIRKGDWLISIGIFDGQLTDICSFDALSNYRPEIQGVDSDNIREMMPKGKGAEASALIDRARHWCYQNGVFPGPGSDRT